MSERDTQRQKVYDAEARAFGEASERLTIEQMQALVDKWGSSKLIQRRYPRSTRGVEVVTGRAGTRGKYSPRIYEASKIIMPTWTRCKWYLAHEYAHHLTTGRKHGWQFCEAYLYLVRCVVGKSAEERLKAEFKAGRVRHRPPRQRRSWTAAQKVEARERMEAINAAKRRPTIIGVSSEA